MRRMNILPETNFQKFTFIFLPFACGYFLSYLYRSTNAVLAPYLSNDLSLNAEQLGLITSAYFLTFGLFYMVKGSNFHECKSIIIIHLLKSSSNKYKHHFQKKNKHYWKL